MNLKRGSMMGLVLAILMTAIVTSPVSGKGGIVKDSGSQSWDYTVSCGRFIGHYEWEVRQIITQGRVVNHKIILRGGEVGLDICSGNEVFYQSYWKQRIHLLYFKDTGDEKLRSARQCGETVYYAVPFHLPKRLISCYNKKVMGPKTKRRVLSHLVEFFIIGVAMGVSEDLIAIHFATDAQITWHVFKVAFLVALPFAIISEIVMDLKIFRRVIHNNHKKR